MFPAVHGLMLSSRHVLHTYQKASEVPPSGLLPLALLSILLAAAISRSCSRDPTDAILERVKFLGETFREHYTKDTEELPGSHMGEGAVLRDVMSNMGCSGSCCLWANFWIYVIS